MTGALGHPFSYRFHCTGRDYSVNEVIRSLICGLLNSIKSKAPCNQTILVSGLKPEADCRSGTCGFCRAMLINREIKLATEETGVRKAD